MQNYEKCPCIHAALFCIDGMISLKKALFSSLKGPLLIPEGFLGGIQEGIFVSTRRLAMLALHNITIESCVCVSGPR